jgi:large subunit ribosomal protein L29
MKAKELRSKTVAELKTDLFSFLQEQFNLRMQRGMADKSAHPKEHSFGVVRRNIARVKTILNEKGKKEL